MTHAPTVSVVVCSYNRPGLLCKALESVLRQTYQDFEIVVVDDASDFDVEQTIAAAFGDARIHISRSKRNRGIAPNTFRGFLLARGRYVAHLDDDDEWEPEMLERLVRELEQHPKAGLAFANHSIMNESGAILERASRRNQERWGRTRLDHGIQERPVDLAVLTQSIPSDASLFRRSALDLDDLPQEIETAWDLWVEYLACRSSPYVVFVPERLARYRVHGQQHTSVFPKLAVYEDLIRIYRRVREDRAAVDSERLRRQLALAYTQYAAALQRERRPTEARAAARNGYRERRTLTGALVWFAAWLPGLLSQRLAWSAAHLKARLRGRR